MWLALRQGISSCRELLSVPVSHCAAQTTRRDRRGLREEPAGLSLGKAEGLDRGDLPGTRNEGQPDSSWPDTFIGFVL